MLSKVASCSLCSIVSAERTFSSRWLSCVRLGSALRRAFGFCLRGLFQAVFSSTRLKAKIVQGAPGAQSANRITSHRITTSPSPCGYDRRCASTLAGFEPVASRLARTRSGSHHQVANLAKDPEPVFKRPARAVKQRSGEVVRAGLYRCRGRPGNPGGAGSFIHLFRQVESRK
jgi:hypothetical protein